MSNMSDAQETAVQAGAASVYLETHQVKELYARIARRVSTKGG
jgi:hypothetical protein